MAAKRTAEVIQSIKSKIFYYSYIKKLEIGLSEVLVAGQEESKL